MMPGDTFTYYQARRPYENDRGAVVMLPMGDGTLSEDDAYQTCRGWGMHGVGDGEVLRITVTADTLGKVSTERVRLYGDVFDDSGARVGSGWLDGR